MPVIREEDLAADGEPEKEFNPGIAGRLPRKTIAGGALIRDETGRILFLETVYKPTLEIPGGVAEFDESPLEACRREVLEEIGLDLEIRDALVVDWIPARGPWFDGVMFIFDGGVMNPEQADRIVLDASEARRHQFLTLDEARDRLLPSMARRLARAEESLKEGTPQYSEYGRGPAAQVQG